MGMSRHTHTRAQLSGLTGVSLIIVGPRLQQTLEHPDISSLEDGIKRQWIIEEKKEGKGV